MKDRENDPLHQLSLQSLKGLARRRDWDREASESMMKDCGCGLCKAWYEDTHPEDKD